MNRITILGVVALTTVFAGGTGRSLGGEMPSGAKNIKVVHAVRAATPPALDGRLDDPCWQKAEAVTGFLAIGTDRPAVNQSFGYVCFDDSNLYIGMKCLMSAGLKPVGAPRTGNDAGIYGGDELVEIMVDPGKSGTDYYQFCVNAYGARLDTARRESGSRVDAKWNGNWEAASHIADGYWSVEVAIPYHDLAIPAEAGSTWGVNLCREAVVGGHWELSSVAPNGDFNVGRTFRALTGLTVDFRTYAFEIGAPEAELTLGEKPRLALRVPVTNRTGQRRNVRIDRQYLEAGAEKTTSVSVVLEPGETFRVTLETLGSADRFDLGNQVAFKTEPLQTRRVVVVDNASGGIQAWVPLGAPVAHTAMSLDVEDAWHAKMKGNATKAVKARVIVDIADAQRASATLHVTLVSPATGDTLAEKLVSSPPRVTDVSFSASDIPWDAYELRASLMGEAGNALLETHSPALVLPGGKEQIKPLNNFVSELVNAKGRGLLDASEISFMNPRDGWCYFAFEGGAQVRLDSLPEAILPVTAWGNPHEAMRYLKTGRHKLAVVREDGKKLDQLIVRSIPALGFDYYLSEPNIQGHGPWGWEFMARHILPHVNTMIDVRIPRKEEHVELWKKIGRKWIAQAERLSVEAPNVDLASPDVFDKVFKIWSESPGYQHPLMDGVICDEFAPGDGPELDIYSRVIEKLNATFPGRTFTPYTAYTFFQGIDKASKLGLASMAGGGYVAPEYYLEQSRTREAAREHIEMNLVNPIRQANVVMPGVNPHLLAVPSYFSAPPMCSEFYPEANYRVFMDMEMRGMATGAGCFGLGGVSWYRSTYTDREYVRWAAHLFRHYCIEGRTDAATDEPYELTHLRNPTFAEGTADWDVRPAEEGTIRADRYPGYGYIAGFYSWRSTFGDTFLVTKRSAKAPNTFSQQLRNLKPGQLYALRMLTGDYSHLASGRSQQQEHAVSIKLDGVETLDGPRNSFQSTYQGTSGWKQMGKFNGKDNPFWASYHWRLFRAGGETATLTVSDWADEKNAGGPIGQELMYNFIKVQPYWPED